MSTITIRNLNPEDFSKISQALKDYNEAKAALERAEANLKSLGVALTKRGRTPGTSGLPYTGKKRGRKPKNPVV